jgi:hypothetical protein
MTQSSGTQGLWLDMKDIYKPLLNLSPVELRALAYGITPFYKLNDHILYGFDQSGNTFAVYSLPEPTARKRSRWARLFGVPECVNLCDYNLLRRHLTCGVCRYKKIKEGKLPPIVPVTVYVLSMGRDRQFDREQGWLVKKLLALVEFISLWGEQHGRKRKT